MVKRLRLEGYWVRTDLKYPDFTMSAADEFIQGDLREVGLVALTLDVEGDPLMKSISLLQTWYFWLYLQMNTLLISCTTLPRSI